MIRWTHKDINDKIKVAMSPTQTPVDRQTALQRLLAAGKNAGMIRKLNG